MLNDLLYNLMLTVLAAAILKIAAIFFRFINSSSDITSVVLTPKRLKRIRNQFLTSVFTLIICVITFVQDHHPYLRFVCAVLGCFAILLLWGAFDALYFPLKEIIEQHPKHISKAADEDVP